MGYIRLNSVSLATAGSDGRHRDFRFLPPAGKINRHRRSIASQAFRNSATNTTRGTGNKRHFVFQYFTHNFDAGTVP
jgi:hypothetical protein